MIQAKTIDGVLLRDMVVAGAALLEKHREAVDALNVFPVPDGDTGTNMSLTMASATREVNQKEYLNAGEAAAAVSKGALKGARGNSGVITSQLLRGFSRALAGVERITPAQFAAALKSGAETAYKAVMKPKEGTILTVARVIAEEAVKQAERTPDDYDALFTNILSTGEVILKKTQQMLPALTQAGVVDAGGRGLLYIYMGYAAVLRGEELPSDDEAEGAEGGGDGECLYRVHVEEEQRFLRKGRQADGCQMCERVIFRNAVDIVILFHRIVVVLLQIIYIEIPQKDVQFFLLYELGGAVGGAFGELERDRTYRFEGIRKCGKEDGGQDRRNADTDGTHGECGLTEFLLHIPRTL